jgi:two-component system, OmpR family, phosphate regulon sensor histidine kinase PhoR
VVYVSLARRITSAYVALILAVVLGVGAYAAWLARSTYLTQLEARLVAEATIVAGEVTARRGEPPADLQALAVRVGAASGARITIIAPDGVVLGDSAEFPGQMENHTDRPEVAATLEGRRGTDVRRSATVGYDMLYVAVPITADRDVLGVARAALPVTAIDRTISSLAGAVVVAIGGVAVVAAAIAFWLGRTTTAPIRRLTAMAGSMAAGRFDTRLRPSSHDEVGELGRAFDRMAEQLQGTFVAIAAERNRLAAILDTVADGLVITDRLGQILMLNPGAERLLGVSAERAIGRRFIEASRDYELAALVSRPDGRSRLVELGLPRRHVRAVSCPIPETDGQRLLLLHDVTELRQAETMRRDFAANVSHELRTPLAAIKAIAETLEHGALDDPPSARQFLARLHSEVDALSELVRELLELSRIESGRARIRPEPIDPEPLLSASAERLSPLARRAGLELRLDISEGLPRVQADGERVGQILANLLHNAIKFTPPGGCVALRARAREDELAISVVDNGVGIPPDHLERVFERFYKTDRSRSGGGTGLGLAIAKHLVQAHGGRIWAESDGAGGSTFTFTLPLAVSRQPAVAGSGTP